MTIAVPARQSWTGAKWTYAISELTTAFDTAPLARNPPGRDAGLAAVSGIVNRD